MSQPFRLPQPIAGVLFATAFTVSFLSGLASIVIAQQQAPIKNPTNPDRWDRQPLLTSKTVLTTERLYKSTPQGDLKLHIWSPETEGADRPCIVFFFGGGWTSGDYRQFARQSAYLASRGMIAASAEYRIRKKHNTTPDTCVEDAKSAIRWVRKHAKELGIDPAKVIAAGGSAGGHLAAATALLPGFDAIDDDLSVSAIPNALVLYNPVVNPSLSIRNVVRSKKGHDITKAISPTLFIHDRTPPTLLFYGSEDDALLQGTEYLSRAKHQGLDVELWIAPAQQHGFFNERPWLEITTWYLDRYLSRLGYLTGEPTIMLPDDAPSLKKYVETDP